MFLNLSHRLISGAHFTLISLIAMTVSPFTRIAPLASFTTNSDVFSLSKSQELFHIYYGFKGIILSVFSATLDCKTSDKADFENL